MIKMGLALALSVSASAAIANDNFNRTDGPLGPNWNVVAGSPEVFNNQARAGGGNQSPQLALFNGGSGNVVEFDVQHGGPGTEYGAAVLGWGGSNNYFVKVQDNGGGAFDSYGFYTGNNSTTGPFGFLSNTFSAGHIKVSLSGSVATLTITPTVGAAQVYSHDYGFVSSGTGIGLGFYGAALIDNFNTAGLASVPEPTTWAMMLGGFGLLGAAARRRTSSAVTYA